MKALIREFFSTANILSLSRLPLAIAIWLTLAQNRTLVAITLAVVSGVTDALDGWIARLEQKQTGRTNRFGAALDPVADKIFAIIVIVALINVRDFPLWLAILVLARDLAIMLAGAVLLKGKNLVIPSNLPGKYYFASLAILIASYIADFAFGIRFFTVVVGLFWLWSSVSYISVLRKTMRGDQFLPNPDNPAARHWRLIFVYAVALVTLYYFFIAEQPFARW